MDNAQVTAMPPPDQSDGLPNRNSRAWELRFGSNKGFEPDATISPSTRAVEYCELNAFVDITGKLLSHDEIGEAGSPQFSTNRYYWGIRTMEDWRKWVECETWSFADMDQSTVETAFAHAANQGWPGSANVAIQMIASLKEIHRTGGGDE